MFRNKISLILILVVVAAVVFLLADGSILFNYTGERESDESSIVQQAHNAEGAEPKEVPEVDETASENDAENNLNETIDSKDTPELVNKQDQDKTSVGQSVVNDNVTQPKQQEQEIEEEPVEEKVPSIIPKQVQSKAETLAGQKVAVKDWIKVADILVGKLGMSEIRFLFDSAKDDVFLNSSVEELEKVRSILFSKLSAQDLETIRTIGRKYNKDMKIIDPNISVEEEKKRAEERAKKSQ